MEEWSDTCLVCGERFFSEDSMSKHIVIKHYDNNSGPEGGSHCQCPFCPFEARSPNTMDKHLYTEHSAEMKTPQKENFNQIQDKAISEHHVTEDNPSCPICGLEEFQFSETLRVHVNSHFIEDTIDGGESSKQYQDELHAMRLQEDILEDNQSKEVAEKLYFDDLKEKYGMTSVDGRSKYSSGIMQKLKKAVGKTISPFNYYSQQIEIMEKLEQGIDDGLSTDCQTFQHLVQYLRQNLDKNQNAYLCSPVDFVGRGPGDAGWGCGYRNIQMLVSSLNKNGRFSDLVGEEYKGNIPSIPKIQGSIEKAWSDGYDTPGSLQLQSKLRNTKKWIGATEAFTYFAHLKLHCRIVDFNGSSTRPRHRLLIQWIKKYFEISSDNNIVTVTEKLPLYFQHDGHSRTIVGIIVSKDPAAIIKLIIFDPGIHPDALWKEEKGAGKQLKTFCKEKLFKHASDLSEKQYQIVCIVGKPSAVRMSQQKDVNAICEKIG